MAAEEQAIQIQTTRVSVENTTSIFQTIAKLTGELKKLQTLQVVFAKASAGGMLSIRISRKDVRRQELRYDEISLWECKEPTKVSL